MTKVMAATPVASTGAVEPECVRAIFHQDLPDGVTLDWEFVRGHDVGIERNALVRSALDGGYSHILFVDSDVLIPLDALANLIEGDDPIVMGFTPMKNTKTGKYSVYRKNHFFDKKLCYTEDDLKGLGPGRVEVKGGGFGCVLISAEVLQDMEPPWFMYGENANGVRRGEDISFCYKAEEHGYSITADPRVVCKHKRSDWL